MADGGGSMTFLQLPREIRNAIYAFIIPRGIVFLIPSENPGSLPEFLSSAMPDLGILWTSKVVQHEVLESLCVNNGFQFSFPRAGSLSELMSQEQANLMQRIVINLHMIVIDFYCERFHKKDNWVRGQFSEALRLFSGDEAKRKKCRIYIDYGDKLDFSPHIQGFFDDVKYLNGFDTIVVVHKLQGITTSVSRVQSYLATTLGPNSVSHEKGVVCNEYHPREFLTQRS